MMQAILLISNHPVLLFDFYHRQNSICDAQTDHL